MCFRKGKNEKEKIGVLLYFNFQAGLILSKNTRFFGLSACDKTFLIEKTS